jgi:RND family efflux transporter MFP subunit
MARRLVEIVRRFQTTIGQEAAGGLSDGHLLERYVRYRDEAAFELLLWRHGGLVLGVCRRLLRREQDAEDAFQATFLTFVRKAPSIVRRGAVAGWLYKVAYRVALEARARADKQARRERPGGECRAIQEPPDPVWRELRPLLDEEMNRLPQRLRLPLVLCYLEGKTNEEAAREIGCPPGTIYSRLARGRDLLRSRLARRGLTLSAAALIAALAADAAAAPPALLIASTLRAALRFATGRTAADCVSARAASLTEGVLRAMFLSKVKLAVLVLLLVGVLVTGGVLTRPSLEAAPEPAADAPTVRVVKPAPGGLERTAVAPGNVVAFRRQDVVPAVSGYVKELSVDIGDRVKAGQVLAVLDAPLLVKEVEQAAAAVELAKGQVLEARGQLATAQADVQAAKALVEQRQAEVQHAQAMLQFSEKELERMRDLLKSRAIEAKMVEPKEQQVFAARAQVQAARAALANARADVTTRQSKIEQATAALRTAEFKVKGAEIALDKARIQEGFTRLTAACDGVVTRRNADPGNFVQAGDQGGRQPLLTVDQTDPVRVVVRVPEQDAALAVPGIPADLVLDALPGRRLSGLKVSRTSRVLDPGDRTMRVEIDVPNPRGLLLPGMFGRATLHLGKGPADALTVPASCLMRRTSGPAVYVVKDGKARLTAVRVGRKGDDKVEILSGLGASDLVVTNPTSVAADGESVEIKEGP